MRADPKGRTFPRLLTLPSNTDVPHLSMMTILKGGLHLRDSPGRMKTHHFVSQSAGDVPVVHVLNRFLPFVLDSCAEFAAGAFHFRSLFQILDSTRKKARSFIQATRLGRRVARTCALLASYRAGLGIAI